MTTSVRHFDNREALLSFLTAPGRYPIEVCDGSTTLAAARLLERRIALHPY